MNHEKLQLQQSYEVEVQSDPTLRFFLREARFDIQKLDHQVNITIASAKIALNKFINKRTNELSR